MKQQIFHLTNKHCSLQQLYLFDKYFGYSCVENGPLVNDIADWLREKHQIVICDAAEPFVDTTAKKPKVVYSFKVKKCNLRDGWNGREYIGNTPWLEDYYEAKRRAVQLALMHMLECKRITLTKFDMMP